MRRLGIVLVLLVVLAALALAADLAATAVAEQRLSDRVSRTLDADAEAEVHGWPLSLRLIEGRVPRVDIAATEVPLGERGELDRLDVTLTGVHVRWEHLTGASGDLPPTDEATFEAELGEEAVQALLGLPEQIIGLELREGLLVLDLAGLAEVDAELDARDGVVVVMPRAAVAGMFGLGEIPLDLRDQPFSPHVHSVTVSEGTVVLAGTLEDIAGGG